MTNNRVKQIMYKENDTVYVKVNNNLYTGTVINLIVSANANDITYKIRLQNNSVIFCTADKLL